MRQGYTTGSCAAAGAKAAAVMLFTRKEVTEVTLCTPENIALSLRVYEVWLESDYASCMIKKDAGDDPDVTNGILIRATVRKCDAHRGGQDASVFTEYPMLPQQEYAAKQPIEEKQLTVFITGGAGIGMVTKPGLTQTPGSYAINPIPRKMIAAAVGEVCAEWSYYDGIEVRLEAVGGKEIAEKTFNARLGIVGGISILGTTGIVEPMSETALIKSIEAELSVLQATKHSCILMSPGNYGRHFIKEQLELDLADAVKCSNFIGQTIDLAVKLNIRGILFVSHIGKLIKTAGGIMDTHSRNADARLELFAANAAVSGASLELVRRIMNCRTTEEVIALLHEKNKVRPVMTRIMERVHFYLNKRAGKSLQIEVLAFSNEYGELGRTKDFDQMLNRIRNEEIDER